MQKAKQIHPNFTEEKRLWRQGYEFVVGLDEAGRGPLAGPVCAAAVCFFAKARFVIPAKLVPDHDRGAGIQNFKPGSRVKPGMTASGIRDSKKLSALQREKWFEILTSHSGIKWGIGMVSEKIIDKINILEATKLAMKKAVETLNCKLKIAFVPSSGRGENCKIDFIILDGKMELDLPYFQKAIVRGDETVFSCAAASIIAKVTRDRLMLKYHKKFPQYGFDRHKGYGTKGHRKAIKKYGVSKIHRKSFRLLSARD